MSEIRLPDNSHRLAIIGRTGSGKTVAAAWHLSRRNFNKMPWIIVNSKGDKLLNSIAKIPGVQQLRLSDPVPKRAGLYMIRPLPETDDEALNDFFWRIWRKGRCGLYCDEGYVIPRSGAFNALLTQGRTLRIPMIVLVQRPVWMTRFLWSESDFFQVFRLSHEDDRDSLRKFLPYDVVQTLPPYHSLWYDVGTEQLSRFAPVPNEAAILNTFRARLEPRERFI